MIYGWQDEMEQLAEFHALLSVFKAVYSWTAQTAIQQCRESCGGHGYLKCELHSTPQLYKLSNTLFILSLLNLIRIADRSAGASQWVGGGAILIFEAIPINFSFILEIRINNMLILINDTST